MSHLGDIDLTPRLSREQEGEQLLTAQRRLTELRLALGGHIGDRQIGPGLLVIFEGWDASGKGGAIKRLVESLDPRHYSVADFGVPTYDEKRHHFMWRFWPMLPGLGGMTVMDRSWYGRVMVERVEGYATEEQWRRAYGEIVDMERSLAAEGTIIVKFWMHMSEDEQLRRFEKRRDDPFRAWTLTPDDWRNRDKRAEYEQAVEEMIERTDHPDARWQLVSGENKRWARVKVVEKTCAAIEAGLQARGLDLP